MGAFILTLFLTIAIFIENSSAKPTITSRINEPTFDVNENPQNEERILKNQQLSSSENDNTLDKETALLKKLQQRKTPPMGQQQNFKRGGDPCYQRCRTIEKSCYDGIENNNEREGMQEMVICMQGTDSCTNDCDKMLGKRTITGERNDFPDFLVHNEMNGNRKEFHQKRSHQENVVVDQHTQN